MSSLKILLLYENSKRPYINEFIETVNNHYTGELNHEYFPNFTRMLFDQLFIENIFKRSMLEGFLEHQIVVIFEPRECNLTQLSYLNSLLEQHVSRLLAVFWIRVHYPLFKFRPSHKFFPGYDTYPPLINLQKMERENLFHQFAHDILRFHKTLEKPETQTPLSKMKNHLRVKDLTEKFPIIARLPDECFFDVLSFYNSILALHKHIESSQLLKKYIETHYITNLNHDLSSFHGSHPIPNLPAADSLTLIQFIVDLSFVDQLIIYFIYYLLSDEFLSPQQFSILSENEILSADWLPILEKLEFNRNHDLLCFFNIYRKNLTNSNISLNHPLWFAWLYGSHRSWIAEFRKWLLPSLELLANLDGRNTKDYAKTIDLIPR